MPLIVSLACVWINKWCVPADNLRQIWFTWWYWFYIVRGRTCLTVDVDSVLCESHVTVTCCMYLIVMSWLVFWCWWSLSLSLLPFLSRWADLGVTVQAGLPLAAVTRGGRERRGEMQGQRFPSPLPSPFCSCTLSTQIILAADGGSTAPLQWDGGVVNYSSLFTNLWFSPGGAAVRWDLSRGSWWTVTQQSAGFHFNQTQQRVRFLLHSAYYLVWSVLFVLDWLKYIFECSIA